MVSINPLIPQDRGIFFKLGGHPQTPGRKYPAPLFSSLFMLRAQGTLALEQADG